MKTLSQSRKAEAGFTLVELAVVMIIIGLLIGGVLKGQEMISNARITSSVAQIKGIEAATSTFRDMFNAMPGDLSTVNATARLPNCAAAPCNSATGTPGNAKIDVGPGVGQTASNEAHVFWVQLAAADLVTGLNPTSVTLAWGDTHPQADVGGGYTVGHTGTAAPAAGVGTFRAGHYLAIQGDPNVAVGTTAGLAAVTSSQAARIDRKMDDGAPHTGTVHAGEAGGCVTGGTLYDEAADLQDCGVYIRIQS